MGCGVGIEALGSPIKAVLIDPPIHTISGFTPKNALSQIQKSALFPSSMEPTELLIPWAIAGFIVYCKPASYLPRFKGFYIFQ